MGRTTDMNGGVHRVVITGTGAVSPYGIGTSILNEALAANRSSIVFLPELADMPGLASHVASVVPETDFSFIPRHYRRSMTNMSMYATSASSEALRSAGHESAPAGTALCLGSTMSSMSAWLAFSEKFLNKQFDLLKTSIVFQLMNHSPLANVSQALNLQDCGYGNCNACATGLMNVGLAYRLIRFGLAETALCGGTDEYDPLVTECFGLMNAASSAFNDRPTQASRPFDAHRGGIVCAEGCGMLFLESLTSAQQRGAKIYGEIIGFGTNTETKNIATPSADSIKRCMQAALNDACIHAEQVDFVNAHATATLIGDAEECLALGEVFGSQIKVNSLKGHMGHTMAASGSLELIASLEMMKQGRLVATMNLEQVSPECEKVLHIRQETPCEVNIFLKNSFALGGTNCSLVIRKFE